MRKKAALTVGFKRTGSEAIHIGKKGLMVSAIALMLTSVPADDGRQS